MRPIEVTTGDTIRITGEFKNYDGNYVTPTNIQLIIYNSKYEILETLTSFENNATGIYTAYYTVPDVLGTKNFIVEWKGSIEGLVNVFREEIKAKFV